jgi:hypothetical protein
MIFILLLSCVTSIAALNCSAGMNSGTSLATQTIPATFPQFLSIVGSFFNSSWYKNPGNLTVGPDNQVGSIRTFVLGTMVYNDTLLMYNLNTSFFQQVWQGPGNNGISINLGSFVLGSYVEHLSGQSTCKGSAVIVNFGSDFCAANLSTATPILNSLHGSAIQQIPILLNISNFTTCGTIASAIRSSSLLNGVISATFGLFWMLVY